MEDSISSSTSPLPLSKTRKRKRDPITELEVDINAAEPPSKKALRNAKKAKTTKVIFPQSTENLNIRSDSTNEAAKTRVFATSPVPKRSDYGIWIGNLPWSVSKNDVRDFINKNTNITDAQITRLHMPGRLHGPADTSRPRHPKLRNRGFAYVDFSTEAALMEAMVLTESLLAGRRVLIKDSKSFEGRPQKPTTKDGDGMTTTGGGKLPSKRIFVGNLAFDTSEQDLQEHFSRCGPVVHVHMATFEDSGKCKGFAWVEFEDLAAGEAAVRGWVDMESVQPSQDEEVEEKKKETDTTNKQSKEKSDDDGGGDDDDDSDKAAHSKRPAASSTKNKKGTQKKKKHKSRRLWVNKIHGRLLRMEFAEDKTVRYKKRYGGKGGVRKEEEEPDSRTNTVLPTAAVAAVGDVAEKVNPASLSASSEPSSQAPHRPAHPRPSASFPHTSNPTAKRGRTSKFEGSAAKVSKTSVARLTGGIVASEGKKTVFT